VLRPRLEDVTSLSELAQGQADLTPEDVDWLHLLLGDWQLLADLSFADLVLWLPLHDGARGGFLAAAQMRPTTGPTVHHDDIVGTLAPRGRRPQLDTAFDERRICRERDPDWPGNVPVREETIPVVRDGRVIAVVSRHTDLAAARTPSRLELTYLRTADDLALMIAAGRFPIVGAEGQSEGGPRVGDGLIRLDATGVVTFASPNALSAYRRLGLTADLAGAHLGDLTSSLARQAQPVDEALSMVISGWAARQTEVEAAGATVRLRVIPLNPGGLRTAALVLVRDVTELRRRERELIGKDATIREIHHRVKNNLQTVAALLRLQGRRLAPADETARVALTEAERRVGSIALVHETLSRTLDEHVDFDEVADRIGALIASGQPAGGDGGGSVRVARDGTFGRLVPEVATPLALVLVELLQNAAQHGLGDAGGTVHVQVRRVVGRDGVAARHEMLVVTVSDNGPGPAPGFNLTTDTGGLGLQIVRTLVESELDGELALLPRSEPVGATAASGQLAGGGAQIRVSVPLPAPPSDSGAGSPPSLP
jgi:two-component system, sensor histidine kinase PdtaS